LDNCFIKGEIEMKILTWNCKFGFNEQKYEFIKNYNADLYIIQECMENDFDGINNFLKYKNIFCDNLDSKYGVGLFSNEFDIEILPEHNHNFRYVVPYKIFNKNYNFVLFLIWTKDKDENNKKIEYTEQIWKAINYNNYKKYFSNNVIIAGDFNSNNYWEKEYISKKVHSHNDIIKKLKGYNIESAYHKYFNCENGNEKDPTLLWKMDINNKFHIDYCFISNNYKTKNVTVGSLEEWGKNKLSDHCPIMVEIE
jgi:endonuclease/exonuclease/phosphatase family metal-dependent hydrolase